MTYCRQGHTLIDNEAEGLWEQLVPGTDFELEVNAVTFFGTVDEYAPPTPTTLVCRLFSDSNRTILVTTPITTGVPYEITNFVDYKWKKQDLQGRIEGDIGLWESAPVRVRDDTGTWVGTWIAEPKTKEENSEVEFKFNGFFTLFKATVDAPIISEQAGVGLAAGAYQYCIVPVDGSGRLGAGSRTLNITLAGTADIFIDWLPNNQVSQWNIYGRQAGGSFGLQATLPGATVSYVDNGTDAPNPAFQPPLFEDPAWTVAVANRTVAIADSGIDSTGDISEDGNQLSVTGQAAADASDVGGFVLDNTIAGLQFDITDLESTIQSTENVLLDPNLFINSPLPPDQQTYVVRYDYHVFINDLGLTVIEETDDQTGQTKRLTFDTVAETITVEIIENAIVLSTAVLVLDPTTVIPTPGSMSSTITYDQVRILLDGSLIGRETMEVNTYQVAPIPVAGLLVLWESQAGSTDGMSFSSDSGVSFTNLVPSSKIVFPPLLPLMGQSSFMWAHGHGWTVVATTDNVVASLATDFSLHWTNDLTAALWPFNDSQGRVAAGDISSGVFNTIHQNLNRLPAMGIVAPANGIGPMMVQLGISEETNGKFQASQTDFVAFFPTTGILTVVNFVAVGGPANVETYTVWPEKNLLVAVDNLGQIHTWDITTNQAAPLTNHQQPFTLIGTPGFLNEGYKFSHSPNELYFIYVSTTGDARRAKTLGGVVWTDVVVSTGSNFATSTPGQEILGILPHHWGSQRGVGKYLHVPRDVHFGVRTFESPDGEVGNWTFVDNTPNVYDFEEKDSFKTWDDNDMLFARPFMYDGSTLANLGPSAANWANSIVRLNTDLSLQAPLNGTFSITNFQGQSSMYDSTLGSAASPNAIPAANLRRYIGRSVIIPVGVAQPLAPFSIRDTSKSAVYGGRNTKSYQTDIGLLDIVIQTDVRGGAGNATFTRIDEGQIILRSLPANLPAESLVDWKDPPINMRWTSNF